MNRISSMSRPEVSVLMSCYNAGRWLHEAVDSVLSQTFQDFEIVLVDDGSTDHTPEIIRQYASRNDRIVAISKTNSGLADSLNAGITQARGHWIARLDADDLCEPSRLDKQIQFLGKHPEVILLGSGFVEIDETGAAAGRYIYPTQHHALLRSLRRMMRFFPHSSAIFKRDIVEVGGAYNPRFRKAQDWDLWFRLSEKGMIACLSECLVKIRKHPEQISASSEGYSQLAYGIAASVCHYLRINAAEFPPARVGNDNDSWPRFLAWVDRRAAEEGIYDRRRMWGAIRTGSSGSHARHMGTLEVCRLLLKSGHAMSLVREKLAGTALPRRLAKEWMMESQ